MAVSEYAQTKKYMAMFATDISLKHCGQKFKTLKWMRNLERSTFVIIDYANC